MKNRGAEKKTILGWMGPRPKNLTVLGDYRKENIIEGKAACHGVRCELNCCHKRKWSPAAAAHFALSFHVLTS